VLTALMQSSDHLPVVADYQLPAKMSVHAPLIPSFVEIGAPIPWDVVVSNAAPATVPNGADELDYAISLTGDASGDATGTDPPLGGGNLHRTFLNASTPGAKSGMLTVTSTSQQVAAPIFSLTISYQVIESFLAADFNKDGAVNKNDLASWATNFGLAIAATKAEGDADLDGDVDGADFLTWQRETGKLPVGAATVTIPEPTSAWALHSVALLALTSRRRPWPQSR
jgi:hypothetical protein